MHPLETSITPDAIVERARALVPILQEREAQAITNRQVPAETIAAFQEAGF